MCFRRLELWIEQALKVSLTDEHTLQCFLLFFFFLIYALFLTKNACASSPPNVTFAGVVKIINPN
jgi:hypothetical protein